MEVEEAAGHRTTTVMTMDRPRGGLGRVAVEAGPTTTMRGSAGTGAMTS